MKRTTNYERACMAILAASLVVGSVSCGGPDNSVQVEQERKDSIERARAAMDAAREAALIKARIEDSLEQLMMTDSLENSEAE